MTSTLVVIIKSLKVPKIKQILLFEMKVLVPNSSCLQNPWLGSYCPQIPVLFVLSSTQFVDPPPPRTKFLVTPVDQTPYLLRWAIITIHVFYFRMLSICLTTQNGLRMTWVTKRKEYGSHRGLPNVKIRQFPVSTEKSHSRPEYSRQYSN